MPALGPDRGQVGLFVLQSAGGLVEVTDQVIGAELFANQGQESASLSHECELGLRRRPAELRTEQAVVLLSPLLQLSHQRRGQRQTPGVKIPEPELIVGGRGSSSATAHNGKAE